MQAGKHQFYDRGVFFRVHTERNAATVVFNRDGAIAVQYDFDALAVPCQGLVSCIVQDLLHDVQWVVRARVHAWSLFDGL